MVDKVETKDNIEDSLITQIAKVELKDNKEDKVVEEKIEDIINENKGSDTNKHVEQNELHSQQTWEELGVNENLIKGLYDMNFVKPSKIQAVSYDICINKGKGKHLIAQSQNGTGKTGAFCVPLLSKIDENLNEVQGIILAHNREMINQIGSILKKIAKYTKITVEENHRDKDIKKAHVVVCTAAGFAKLFLEQRKFKLDSVRTLVIDEADFQMKNDGSIKNIQQFFNILRDNTKLQIQVLMFSATFEKENYKFIAGFFPKNIVNIKVEKKEDLTLNKVRQLYIRCNNSDKTKDNMVEEFLKANIENERVIIFTNKRDNCVKLCDRLRLKGYKTFLLIGGDMSPENRDETVKRFNAGEIQILITTDLLSRGFDEKLIKLIINYDIPVFMDENDRRWKVALDTYLHRVGRTGRFNTKGIGLNLVEERYMNNINQIEEHYKCKIEEIKDMNDLIAEFKKLLNEF